MNMPAPPSLLMSGDEYRESLRRYRPRVFLDGRLVESVVDEPGFAPGMNAIALTYDYALKAQYAKLMTAVQQSSGKTVAWDQAKAYLTARAQGAPARKPVARNLGAKAK